MSLPQFIGRTCQTLTVPARSAVGAADAAALAAGAPQPTRLGYPQVDQEFSQWCWAAVAVGVARCFTDPVQWGQCAVAERVLQRACCNGAWCNEQAGLGKALREVGHLKPSGIQASPIAFSDVQDEIDAGRPVGVRWLKGGRGHFVAVYGYLESNGRQYVYVADPGFKASKFEFGGLSTRSQPWTNTYFTQP